MEIKAISDAGHIIHLSEISKTACFSLFSTVLVTHEVYSEVKACNLPGNDEIESKVFEIVHLESNKKDRAEYYSLKYDISIADATVITLAKYTGINLILTDDLDVRDILKSQDMQPVGSIGILLRAYRERVIPYNEALEALENLQEISSLYVTSKLIENAKQALKEYDAGHRLK
ncbi:MAG: PIN domain-containing protein [ANME-2 cluster archaeon]|jgi:predicted nucleic acid-binding protein|nr:PIN domain-containing protein [ANME-2 cluster archaeon]